MAERSKAFEIIIAALAVIVTAIVGVSESRRATDSVEVQVMSLVAPHLSNLAKPGPDFAAAERVVVAAAEYLSNQHSRTALATMAARISEGNAAASAQSVTQLQEATAPSSSSAKWFAVLATLPSNDEPAAKRQANEWLARVSAKKQGAKVALYKTKISNHYAVVLGGPVGQTEAIALMREVRTPGLAADAFAQKDRDWQLVGTAPFPQ